MKLTFDLLLVIFLTLLIWMVIALIGSFLFPPIETVTATEVKEEVKEEVSPYVVYGECPNRFRGNRFDAAECQNRLRYYTRHCSRDQEDSFFMCDAGERAGVSQYCTGHRHAMLGHRGSLLPKGFKRTCSELRALIFEKHGIRIIKLSKDD